MVTKTSIYQMRSLQKVLVLLVIYIVLFINVYAEMKEIRFFGKIDLNKTEEWYETIAEIDGEKIAIDLNFEETSVEYPTLQPTVDFIANLESLIDKSKTIVQNDLINGTETKKYLLHHLEVLEDSELKSFNIDINTSEQKKLQSMFGPLYLKRIGFYPEDHSRMIVCDYTISSKITDYLLVIVLNAKGELVEIVEES